jgi:hypothetical protein
MNRIRPTLLTAAAALFGGAATASANQPMRIVTEAPSLFVMQDEEFWDIEAFKWNAAGMTIGTLPAGNGSFKFKYVRCMGNEVRAELFIDGYRWAHQEFATLTAHIDLYEGASCSTEDLDGQSDFEQRTLTMGQGRNLTFSVKNEQEDSEDGAWVEFRLRALPA